MSILKDIIDIADLVTEEQIDLWASEVADFYNKKILFLAIKAYGSEAKNTNSVSFLAFKNSSEEIIKKALKTFLLKNKLHKKNRDLNTYLITSLNRLANKTILDKNNIKKTSSLICPACRELGSREFLTKENKLWRCKNCTIEVQRIASELLKKEDNHLYLQERLILHKAFELHSRRGYKCNNCAKFLPQSLIEKDVLICIYPKCGHEESLSCLNKMSHPISYSNNINISLDVNGKSENFKYDKKSASIQLESYSIDASNKIELMQRAESDLEILNDVISKQKDSVTRSNNSVSRMQKYVMYEAFYEIIKDYPEEMIAYLVHEKQNHDFFVQATIFQMFIKLMEEHLPLSINNHNIYSLLDPKIKIFLGQSEYEAKINDGYIVPNLTNEVYVGRKKMVNYGPCFIGQLVDIIDMNNNMSLMNNVENYSFSRIKLMPNVNIGDKVLVKHNRIPSHYEMGSLAYVQRVRRKIVDSVYFRINGVKRK